MITPRRKKYILSGIAILAILTSFLNPVPRAILEQTFGLAATVINDLPEESEKSSSEAQDKQLPP